MKILLLIVIELALAVLISTIATLISNTFISGWMSAIVFCSICLFPLMNHVGKE